MLLFLFLTFQFQDDFVSLLDLLQAKEFLGTQQVCPVHSDVTTSVLPVTKVKCFFLKVLCKRAGLSDRVNSANKRFLDT